MENMQENSAGYIAALNRPLKNCSSTSQREFLVQEEKIRAYIALFICSRPVHFGRVVNRLGNLVIFFIPFSKRVEESCLSLCGASEDEVPVWQHFMITGRDGAHPRITGFCAGSRFKKCSRSISH